MKRVISAVVTLMLALSLCACDSNGVVARIEFSAAGYAASARHITYDLSSLEGRETELDGTLGKPATLKNVSPDIDTGKLLEAFGMTGATSEKKSDPDGREYTSGTRSLILYDSGIISYSDSSLYEKESTLTAEQAAELIGNVARQAGLDLSQLTLADTYETEYGWSVSYSRTINGIKVVGRTGLTAEIKGDGISGFRFLSTAYGNEVDMELIGVSAAMDELLTENSSQSFGRPTDTESAAITDVKVTDVSLVYWDSAYTQTKMNQTHIQPVYCFIGICIDREGNETTFTGYVRAISDEHTTNFHVENIEE